MPTHVGAGGGPGGALQRDSLGQGKCLCIFAFVCGVWGCSVFCSGSCSRSKLLIFVSTQGRRGSELVSVSQENLWVVTDRG